MNSATVCFRSRTDLWAQIGKLKNSSFNLHIPEAKLCQSIIPFTSPLWEITYTCILKCSLWIVSRSSIYNHDSHDCIHTVYVLIILWLQTMSTYVQSKASQIVLKITNVYLACKNYSSLTSNTWHGQVYALTLFIMKICWFIFMHACMHGISHLETKFNVNS